ncbi:MAG: hypothetical protein AAF655_18765 [Bacteroidota bacterium]
MSRLILICLLSGSLCLTVRSQEAERDDPQDLYSLSKENTLGELRGFSISVAIHPEGTVGMVSDHKGWLYAFDLQTYQLLWESYQPVVMDMAFSQDGYFLVTGSQDSSLKVWPTTYWYEEISPAGINLQMQKLGRIETVAISPTVWFEDDSVKWVAAGIDRDICLWYLKGADWKYYGVLGSHKKTVTGLDFHPDGHFLVSSGGDKNLQLWDMETLKLDKLYKKAHGKWIKDVVFSPVSDKHFISSSKEGRIHVWRTDSLRTIEREKLTHAHSTENLAFYPNKSLLVSVGQDQAVRTWEGQRMDPTLFEGVLSFVPERTDILGVPLSIDFDRYGERMITSSYRNFAQLWRIQKDIAPKPILEPTIEWAGSDATLWIEDASKAVMLEAQVSSEVPIEGIWLKVNGKFFPSLEKFSPATQVWRFDLIPQEIVPDVKQPIQLQLYVKNEIGMALSSPLLLKYRDLQ